ncbi:hypothetical protein C1I95_06070 [Micromonospora craterilacus]|uniref:Uncharacterized protein n=1 Tax=Micromonospora craterilacus TaxID=1655439 RepID=A0A2W2EHN9_9ACTN|nr:hypothetical protein C1I95_06070 [Micromonospora craterilacus]
MQESTRPVTDLLDLGAAAYSYTDESGLGVVTYDANLYLTVSAAALRLGADLPDGLAAALRAIALSALDSLRG